MKTKILITLVLALGIGSSYAAESPRNFGTNSNAECPAEAKFKMDAQYGPGTSANTTCITKRDQIKVVINLGAPSLNRKDESQMFQNVNNMIENYEKVYGMTMGKEYQIQIVAQYQGGRFLMTNEAYNRGLTTATGNRSIPVLEALMKKGVTVSMCQNTMKTFGWSSADLVPGVKMVPAGVVTLADLASQGWTVLTP